MSQSLQFLHKCTSTPSATSDSTVPKEFCLDDIIEHICTTQRITISSFGALSVHGQTDVRWTLYVSSCAGRADVGSPPSCLCCANCYTAPSNLSSANLPEEPKDLPLHDFHESHHCDSSPSQLGAIGYPSNENFGRVSLWSQEGEDSGWVKTYRICNIGLRKSKPD